MFEPIKIFVYGTLKPGENNYECYCKDRVLKVEAATVLGQLYDLPFGYPAMTIGDSLVYGFLLSFADATILADLDELEDYSPNRSNEQNEYIRVTVEAFDLKQQSLGLVWTYLMEPERIDQFGGTLLPHGKWYSKD